MGQNSQAHSFMKPTFKKKIDFLTHEMVKKRKKKSEGQ